MFLILILSKYNSNIFLDRVHIIQQVLIYTKEESLTLDKVKLLSRYIEAFKYTKYDFFIVLFIGFVQILLLITIGIVC